MPHPNYWHAVRPPIAGDLARSSARLGRKHPSRGRIRHESVSFLCPLELLGRTVPGQGKFWRLAAEGKKRAIVAVAHTLLVLVYEVLGQTKPYQERQTSAVEERHRKRLIRHHVRSLGPARN
jgi:hypothetical protein